MEVRLTSQAAGSSIGFSWQQNERGRIKKSMPGKLLGITQALLPGIDHIQDNVLCIFEY
jgi:hypothetical protein